MTKMLFDTGIKLNDVMWFSANLSSTPSNFILWTCLILTSSMCIWALFLSLLLRNAIISVLFNFIENLWISCGLICPRSDAMSNFFYISHHIPWYLCHWQTWILLDVMSWIYHWCVRWIALTKYWPLRDSIQTWWLGFSHLYKLSCFLNNFWHTQILLPWFHSISLYSFWFQVAWRQMLYCGLWAFLRLYLLLYQQTLSLNIDILFCPMLLPS